MNHARSRLTTILAQGQFAVTVEFNPPKGCDISGMLDVTKSLLGRIHGVNVTDNTAAVMRASSLAVCRLFYEQGHDPVFQVTCRDRNRLGIQSDLLGAHLLGIRNVLCLTGDPPSVGDHRDAKPVYDFNTIQLMQAIGMLNHGSDWGGNALEGSTDFSIGGAVSPEADTTTIMHQKFSAKIQAGAQFFQTQAVFCQDGFTTFMKDVRPYGTKVLAGILVLRSVKMAEFLNANIPGLSVPEAIISELRDAGERAVEAGIEIAVRTIKAIRPHCDGVHLMAPRGIERLPEILTKAELGP